MLQDTVEDTPYTLGALRRGFGAGVSPMVAELMALDHIPGTAARRDSRPVMPYRLDAVGNRLHQQWHHAELCIEKSRAAATACQADADDIIHDDGLAA